MELPKQLKTLYRHWSEHVAVPPTERIAIPDDMQRFIAERIAIWERKTLGATPPYTTDPILANFRFCNILRECDRQTIEYHTLLNPLRDDFPRWLMNMFYCRMVARPETVRTVGLLTFNPDENDALYQRLMASARPRYGTPYVFPVSVIQRSTTPTRELFIARHLPAVMNDIAREIHTWNRRSVYDGVAAILPLFGYNLTFLWTETLIDTAYQFPQHIDLFARFPIGPGAAPTFNRIAPSADASQFVAQLAATHTPVPITYNGNPLCLSAENWEGIGCEFRKYTNLKAGKGRRRVYSPAT